jgi:hypothetical protein
MDVKNFKWLAHSLLFVFYAAAGLIGGQAPDKASAYSGYDEVL